LVTYIHKKIDNHATGHLSKGDRAIYGKKTLSTDYTNVALYTVPEAFRIGPAHTAGGFASHSHAGCL